MSFNFNPPRFKKIDIDDIIDFKGLIIADFHLYESETSFEEDDLLIKNLKLLVAKVNPTHVFVLGDIIHFLYYRSDKWYYNFFNKLESNFKIPIYIIPGNHDYSENPPFKNCFDLYGCKKNVKCFEVEILEIQYSDEFSVFLGHDVGFNCSVHGKKNVIKWMNIIRNHKYCSKIIKNNDVFIVGHTHENIDDDKTKNYSIAPFSVSLGFKNGSYGIISFKKGFKFKHKNNFKMIMK